MKKILQIDPTKRLTVEQVMLRECERERERPSVCVRERERKREYLPPSPLEL